MIRVRDIVLVHFALNPDDELTREDVAAKTGRAADSTVWEALSTMVADGLLRTRSMGRVFMYRPGPALLRMCGHPCED